MDDSPRRRADGELPRIRARRVASRSTRTEQSSIPHGSPVRVVRQRAVARGRGSAQTLWRPTLSGHAWYRTENRGLLADSSHREHTQNRVRASDLCVIVVLCDDEHAMLDCRSRDERIGELDSAVDPRSEAIGNESGPRSHYSLGDRYRICTPSQSEGVGASSTASRSAAFSTPSWSSPMVTTDTATRSGSSPRGRPVLRAMNTDVSSSPTFGVLKDRRECRQRARRAHAVGSDPRRGSGAVRGAPRRKANARDGRAGRCPRPAHHVPSASRAPPP